MKFKSLLLKQSLIKKKRIKMKFQIHAHQKINFKIVSKKSIIILGLALVAFANVSFAKKVNSLSI
jgi:hypothetical protein